VSLAKLLGPYFIRNIQSRGATYADAGRVRVEEHSATALHAVVRGATRYDVDLSFDGATLRVRCSCPHFDDGNPCKHVWATALTVDRTRELDGWAQLDAHKVEFDFADSQSDGLDDDYDLAAYSEPLPSWMGRAGRPPSTAGRRMPQRDQGWRSTLQHVASASVYELGFDELKPGPDGGLPEQDVCFVLDGPLSAVQGELVVDVARRTRKRNGDWSKLRAMKLSRGTLHRLGDPLVRRTMLMLAGAREGAWGYGGHGYSEPLASKFALTPELAEALLPELCAAGRCLLALGPQVDPVPLAWDDGGRWVFRATLQPRPAAPAGGKSTGGGKGSAFVLGGAFHRNDERLPLSEPDIVIRDFLVIDGRLSRMDAGMAWPWIAHAQRAAGLVVDAADVDSFLEAFFALPAAPPIDLPDGIDVSVESPVPVAWARLEAPKPRARVVTAELTFEYAGVDVHVGQAGTGIFRAAERRAIRRDPTRERDAEAFARRLGFTPYQEWGWRRPGDDRRFEIAPERVAEAVRAMVAAGWKVEADGRVFRPFTAGRVSVRSGVDWFELHGELSFAGEVARTPDLLKALARGERFVPLGDGSLGMVPEEWLKRFAGLVDFGEPESDHVRFRPTQAALLDALLAAQPEVDVDAGFERARSELRRFTQVVPAGAPPTFVGELRGYQEEGLGWLQFLRTFGFGGCLADDMGLGKTVMVLALLDSLRADDSAKRRPSLVVAPKSVVFNWRREAERFAPRLRVIDYTGADRDTTFDQVGAADLVLTSYGTLRRDVVLLKDVDFEYAILDEAQAIKNQGTASAKAARLLRARHRLALSGTPIENHVGELWSIFEFLNPGMLGASRLFKTGAAVRGEGAGEHLRVLGEAVRPFILRRTKSQVAQELPARQEETIWCELSPRERRQYDELRDHYRSALLGHVGKEGLGRAKLQVLEALLRLRQAACHPGLVDKSRSADGSSKVDALLEQVREVIEEGHKALVFSQFTSLLALVRRRLDSERIPYEYLDGKTRDREELVERFQRGDEAKLFLISLKAGGLGLNLTAADYVFLLDPWWNPAAEAQAIDRAHRIGQTRPVFAYRLIARDTVEERILELQQQKRQLADAIISEDNSVIANLTREELERLLG
jgi:superfamily II DNA or RNA helicase